MRNEQQIIIIKKYDGNLDLIKNIKKLITSKYAYLFHSVIVHGSVATNEVIPYSDFDGLLIIKDRYIDSKELRRFKKESMKIILKFDPLQHHGWFQIKESELNDYPQDYLPYEILEHSKVIYPITDTLNLKLIKPDKVDYNSSLRQIIEQFHNRLKNNWKPKNCYELKSMLSQIMLIPSMYYSVINNEGIFKAKSFIEVKPYFSEDEWMPIEISTRIRLKWSIKINPIHKFLISVQNPLIQKIMKTYFMPKIDNSTKTLLSTEFYKNLEKLIQKIKKES